MSAPMIIRYRDGSSRDYSLDPRPDRALRYEIDRCAEVAACAGMTYVSRELSLVSSRYRVTRTAALAALERAFRDADMHIARSTLPLRTVQSVRARLLVSSAAVAAHN